VAECEKTETGYITKRHAQQYGPIREQKALKETIKFLAGNNLIELRKEDKSTLIRHKPMKSGGYE
jgi:hypothetical protein